MMQRQESKVMKDVKKIKLGTSQALVLKHTRDDVDRVLSACIEVLRQDILSKMMETKRVEDAEDLRIQMDTLIQKKDTLRELFIDDEYRYYFVQEDTLKQKPAWADYRSLVRFSLLVDWCLDYDGNRILLRAEEVLHRDCLFQGWRMIEVCKELIKELLVKFH